MKKLAYKILFTLFTGAIVYHILIMSQVIPYKLAWGGRLKSLQEMYVFETFSLILNLLFMVFIGIHLQFIQFKLHPIFAKSVWWFLAIVFAFNTLGNLYAIYPLEKYIFTPITFLSSLFSFVVIFGKESKIE